MAVATCSRSGVLHVTFNQDCTCVALGSQQGVHIYNVDTHKLVYRHAIGAVSLVEMLFCTSLVGYVGAGEQPALTPRKLTVMNTTANRLIQEFTYTTSVLGVRMNRQRLVVVTARRVHVYGMHDLTCLRVIDTEESQKGCCALTAGHEPNLLALPSSATTGTLRIYDLAQEGGNVLSEVQAHQTPVMALAWNSDGSLLASASGKGTVIRVHRMPRATRMQSFRRGSTPAAVQCMAFSPPGLPWQLLAATSSHGTVHVFRIEDPDLSGASSRPGSAAVGMLSAVMRISVADLVEPARNIATIRLPQGVGTAVCAFRPTPPTPDTPDADEAAVPAPTSGGGGGSGGYARSASAGGGLEPASSLGQGGLAEGGMSEGGVGAGRAEAHRAVVMVATHEGLLYEYTLTDLTSRQGPKCALEGEWSLLGSGSVLG